MSVNQWADHIQPVARVQNVPDNQKDRHMSQPKQPKKPAGGGHCSTPDYVFEYANQRWGPFTLDVAAEDWNAKCRDYYTKEDNALNISWQKNDRIWMNPPWDNIGPWVWKASDHKYAGGTTVALLPTRTGQPWFFFACRNASVYWITGRIKFGRHPSLGTAGDGGFEDCAFFVFEPPITVRGMKEWYGGNKQI